MFITIQDIPRLFIAPSLSYRYFLEPKIRELPIFEGADYLPISIVLYVVILLKISLVEKNVNSFTVTSNGVGKIT